MSLCTYMEGAFGASLEGYGELLGLNQGRVCGVSWSFYGDSRGGQWS